MFSRQDNPQALHKSLQLFIEEWFAHKKPWYGVDETKLNEIEMPEPLKWLYGFAGEWYGRKYYWETLFSHQDSLFPVELLKLVDGKLVFLYENQGVWDMATLPSGEDPPVWYRYAQDKSYGEWILIDDSLSRFLVNFLLFEVVCGCRFRTQSENLIRCFKERGAHVVPLWLDAPYPGLTADSSRQRKFSFHLADGKFLIHNNSACGTNIDAPWHEYPDLFKPENEPTKLGETWPLPASRGIPPLIQIELLKRKIREIEPIMEDYKRRIEQYKQAIRELEKQ
ncbi:MAG: hypothetical protein R3C11_22020 [Planctomycetaceae bacterium]